MPPGAGTGRPPTFKRARDRRSSASMCTWLPAVSPGPGAPEGSPRLPVAPQADSPARECQDGTASEYFWGSLTSCPFALLRRKRAQREDRNMAQRLPVSPAGVVGGEARELAVSLGPVAAVS